MPLGTQVETRKYNETVRILDQAKESLLGFVAANGYFPCPADFAGISSGHEAVGSDHISGSCPASVTGGATPGIYIGYLPAAALGLNPVDSNGYAVDGWGTPQNRIRYAVSSIAVGGVTNPFTRTTGIRNAGMTNIISSTLLSVCRVAPTSITQCDSTTTTLTSNAVAVVWSLGSNAATTGGLSTTEAKNAQNLAAADRVFVSRERSGVSGSEFDDVVTWISPPILFNKLIAAGNLP